MQINLEISSKNKFWTQNMQTSTKGQKSDMSGRSAGGRRRSAAVGGLSAGGRRVVGGGRRAVGGSSGGPSQGLKQTVT